MEKILAFLLALILCLLAGAFPGRAESFPDEESFPEDETFPEDEDVEPAAVVEEVKPVYCTVSFDALGGEPAPEAPTRASVSPG